MNNPSVRIVALEGYYGPPLDPAERDALVRWLPTEGYTGYVYSPKDDPYQRARWREPYPDERRDTLVRTAHACREAGIEFGLTISPGLDWKVGDPTEIDTLTAKVEHLLTTGATTVGIAWDDTPGEGATVGADHGQAVAEVVRRIARPDIQWMTCPVHYAVSTPTTYLRAFADAVGDGVDLIWTGPSVVTTRLEADHVVSLRAGLGRPLLYAENFPVNDLGMAGVLHLGPYPDHEPAAMAQTTGVLVNFMSLPRASRIGLAVAGRAWSDPHADRNAAWDVVVDAHPGLRPLALACRAWLDQPGPDPWLLGCAEAAGPEDQQLRAFLTTGCRDGLDPALASEVGPWLDAWEREANVMTLALDVLDTDQAPSFGAAASLAIALRSARQSTHQAFGTRWAIYPSTARDETELRAASDAVIDQDNLTDVLVARALGRRP